MTRRAAGARNPDTRDRRGPPADAIAIKRVYEPPDSNVRFAQALAAAAGAFFVPFAPVLAYVCSDEINLLFLRTPIFRRVEKIDSIFAGFASTALLSELTIASPTSAPCRSTAGASR